MPIPTDSTPLPPQPILFRNVRVVTHAAPHKDVRGLSLGSLTIREGCSVHTSLGRIDEILAPGEPSRLPPTDATELVIEGNNRALLPGLVDCHTHLCWAGDRLDEWEMKLAGKSYLDILRSGGGIMNTVRAVREASQDQLALGIRARLDACLALGTTTIEIKSGYGLSTDAELKMLRAIRQAAETWPGTVVPTALLGHAIDDSGPGGEDGFINRTITETLPAVVKEFPLAAIDAFCEDGAWTVDQTLRLFRAAKDLGAKLRVHADQFSSQGMVEAAIELGAISVDHLEASRPETIAAIGHSRTVGVGLPGCGLHLGGSRPQFADLRSVIDAGGAVAVATNCNPGSSPTLSMPLAMAAAVRYCGLTPFEALAAGTIVPAHVLGDTQRGVIREGAAADLILLSASDPRELVFQLGNTPISMVIAGGRIVHELPSTRL